MIVHNIKLCPLQPRNINYGALTDARNSIKKPFLVCNKGLNFFLNVKLDLEALAQLNGLFWFMTRNGIRSHLP